MASPSTVNGRSGRTLSSWFPKCRRISVGQKSECADCMRGSYPFSGPVRGSGLPYRTAWQSRGANLSAPNFDPHRPGAAALERLVQACPRRLPRPRRSILSGWELRTLTFSAASFRSIICSQKEVTALLPLSLANSATRIACGERP